MVIIYELSFARHGEMGGSKIFHRLNPKYFSDPFCGSFKKNFNLRDNLKFQPYHITVLDNIIASTFNNIPLHIRSSLNVKLFNTNTLSEFAQRLVGFVLLSLYFVLLLILKTFLSNEIYANKKIYI